MAVSYADITVTRSWVNIAVGNPALANVPLLIQRKDNIQQPVFVFFGGAVAPASNTSGIMLMQQGDPLNGTAPQVWVRSDATGASIYAGAMD